jgi:hypothetical protein
VRLYGASSSYAIILHLSLCLPQSGGNAGCSPGARQRGVLDMLDGVTCVPPKREMGKDAFTFDSVNC